MDDSAGTERPAGYLRARGCGLLRHVPRAEFAEIDARIKATAGQELVIVLDTILLEVVTFVGLTGSVLGVMEWSYRVGRGHRESHSADRGQLGTIQGAILGLLALLLGFAFAGASARFVERQDVIVSEANAIGTAYLRADLLPTPHDQQLRDVLRRYTDVRIEFFEDNRLRHWSEIQAETARLHAEMWSIAQHSAAEQPLLAMTVLPPVNEVIDLHTTRVAAMRRHLPLVIMALLVVCAWIAIATVGYGCGLGGQRTFWATTALGLLIALVLWITFDLDYPRRGLIRINQQPILELREGLGS